MNKKIIIVLLTSLIVVSGIGYYFISRENVDVVTSEDTQEISEEANINAKNNDIETQNDDTEEVEDTPEVAASGKYIPYSKQSLSNGTNLIFFHAGWCPTCRILDDDLVENIAEFPNDLIILKADFDSETQLRQEYGVKVQHTLVQVDAEGNEIQQWVGSLSLKDLLENI